MKAVVEIAFSIDGESPAQEILEKAIIEHVVSPAQYVGSEAVDGTDNWGMEIHTVSVKLQAEKEGADDE